MSFTKPYPIGIVVFLYLQLSYTVTIKGLARKLAGYMIYSIATVLTEFFSMPTHLYRQ